MDESEQLARSIPTLRTTFDALTTRPPDDPVARYARALLTQILATLEARHDGAGVPRRPHS